MPEIVFTPRHAGQRRVCEVWDKSQAIIIIGPAGTGKSSCALAMALKHSSKVILCRPAVAIHEDLGHYPGTLEEKLAVWMGPFTDVLGDVSHANRLHKWRSIEVASVGLLGGRTIKNGVLLIDEAQNCTKSQLKCALTRVGENGKVVLCGDYEQSMLKGPNPLKEVAEKLSLVEGAVVIHFLPEHQQRSPFVQRVLEVL